MSVAYESSVVILRSPRLHGHRADWSASAVCCDCDDALVAARLTREKERDLLCTLREGARWIA